MSLEALSELALKVRVGADGAQGLAGAMGNCRIVEALSSHLYWAHASCYAMRLHPQWRRRGVPGVR